LFFKQNGSQQNQQNEDPEDIDPEAYLEEILTSFVQELDLIGGKKKSPENFGCPLTKVSFLLNTHIYRIKNDF
jgi:hypothetical protein